MIHLIIEKPSVIHMFVYQTKILKQLSKLLNKYKYRILA